MANTEMRKLFEQAQIGATNHKKYIKLLCNIYEKQELTTFFCEFKKYLIAAFVKHPSHSYANSIIKFASTFCVEIISNYERQMRENNENEEYDTHPLFTRLVSEILEYVCLADLNVRFHSCQFLGMLFMNFGPDITISDAICDGIQKAMLKRLKGPKPQIRLQAIKVLTRLQNPSDRNCPVIESFIDSLADPVSSVRKAIIENIAPCRTTFGHIITCLRDIDAGVRAATYIKLSKLSPKLLSIAYRQSILTNGLVDINPNVKRTFEQVLLPKWLNAYDSNVIQFMLALKLDANEEDYKQTEQIYERVLPTIFKTISLQELLEQLELEDDTKIATPTSLTIEKVTYWNSLINYIKELEEENDMVPLVINLVSCINSFVKSKSDKSLDRWEYLEYQQVLRKLFELLKNLDNSDEFGRQATQKCVISVLTNVKMEEYVLAIVIRIFHAILPDLDKLAYELCSIIADIKDPLEAVEVSDSVSRANDMQVAQLKVKRHMLTDELKKALDERQYELIDKLSKEGEILEQELKDLEEKIKSQTVQLRKPRHDADTVCRCLDIIIAFLGNVAVNKLPNSLITFKDEFLQSGDINFGSPGVYRRIFKIHCLYSIVDKNLALQRLELIYTPLIEYRVSSDSEKTILKTAVGAVSDLIRIYGPEIFENFATKKTENQKNNTTLNKRTNDRTLYSGGDYDSETETSDTINITGPTSNVLIDIMLSMLDDDHPDFRAYVTVALMKLVTRGLCVNSSLIARLLVKWFNPVLDSEDKHDQKVQRYIGEGLTRYIHEIQTGPTCLENAIIPTLCYIGNAPKTSPLAEVSHDDVLHCLIKFTKIRETTTLNVHKNVAYSILSRVTKTREPAERILTKMLTFLDVPIDEPNVIKELSQQIRTAQENVSDKVSLTYLKRYFNKLNAIIGEVNESANTISNTLDITNETTRTSTHTRERPSRNRSSVATDESNIEGVIDENNENDRLSTLSKDSCGNPRNTRCGTELHTIEEQQEEANNESCTAEAPPTDNSQGSPSDNSVFTDVNEDPLTSPRRKKGKGKTNGDMNLSETESSSAKKDAKYRTPRRNLRSKSAKT